MALSVVHDGEDSLEVWRVVACLLNEWIIDPSCFSTSEVGLWANSPSPEANFTCYKALHRALSEEQKWIRALEYGMSDFSIDHLNRKQDNELGLINLLSG
jgi:hypothetical protein